jgi:sucrose phosphorylase
MSSLKTIRTLLHQIYGPEKGGRAFERIIGMIENFPDNPIRSQSSFTQNDTVLITYADSLKNEGEAPLKTFRRFAREHFKDVFSTVHFLPFFPYSSDDGFSVMDFFAIDPDLGDWSDITALGDDFDLMFDMVLNHVSAKSQWFQNYLKDETGYEALAMAVDPTTDLSKVTRPRALPLLSHFTKESGESVHLWTTFSEDQIDLNYQSLDVLEKMVSVLLFYVEKGARVLRFDAIAYLWKEIGTSCIHLPQTHAMVKLFRAILNAVAPSVSIITETNVPHPENISYFGSGRDEAQMVYNFTLPPLLLHAFLSEDARHLSRWAAGLETPSQATTFFNFTASHDGIGVRPLEGILPEEEIMKLANMATAHGAGASMKKNQDGSDSPYELNITYIDAILCGGFSEGVEPSKKFLASQAIQYILPGVPATYIHSILGSRNWDEGVRLTGRARSINREKLALNQVLSRLKDPETLGSRIFHSYIHLINARKNQAAFHPNAAMEVLDIHPAVFSAARKCNEQTVYTFTNVSSNEATISLTDSGLPLEMLDLLTGNRLKSTTLHLAPYGIAWLTPR